MLKEGAKEQRYSD